MSSISNILAPVARSLGRVFGGGAAHAARPAATGGARNAPTAVRDASLGHRLLKGAGIAAAAGLGVSALGLGGLLAASARGRSVYADPGGDGRTVPTFDPEVARARLDTLHERDESLLRKPADLALDLASELPKWVPGAATIHQLARHREVAAEAVVEGARAGVSPLRIREIGQRSQLRAVELTRTAYESRRTPDGTNGDGRPWDYDNEIDAMRHSTGIGAMKVRLMRDEGLSPEQAERLVLSIGVGKEQQGVREGSNSAAATQMDLHNNLVGSRIVGDGRNADGSWMTDEQVFARMQEQGAGHLVSIVDGGEIVAVTPAGLDA